MSRWAILGHAARLRRASTIISPRAPVLSDCCWKCGKRHSHSHPCVLFCASQECGVIQRLSCLSEHTTCNFYELFSIADKRSISINPLLLDASFKALQRLFHPDKFANASAEERAISAENSSVVNQGYQTLKCRVDRINYVLTTFYNIKVLDEGGSYNDATLMTEVFELRERVDDASNNSDEARSILIEVDNSLEALTAQIELLLQKNGADGLALLKAVAVRFKYYSKIREEVREKLEVN